MKRFEAYHIEKPVVAEGAFGFLSSDNKITPEKNIKVYIDEKQKEPTINIDKPSEFPIENLGRSFISDRIQKNSTIIRIEVTDGDNKPILMTNGTVDSFLEDPQRCSPYFEKGPQYGSVAGFGPNCLVIDIFWEDEIEKFEPESFDWRKKMKVPVCPDPDRENRRNRRQRVNKVRKGKHGRHNPRNRRRNRKPARV